MDRAGDIEILPTQEWMMPQVARIYDAARTFMRSTGNMRQWSDSYPSIQSLRQDMDAGCSYVVLSGGRPVGTFFFRIAPDPTYSVIYGGQWLNDKPYGVIHRAATDGTVSRLMDRILDFCLRRVDNIRIDTHRDNAPMQRALMRYGFTHCGIIYLANGDERLAYHLDRSARY